MLVNPFPAEGLSLPQITEHYKQTRSPTKRFAPHSTVTDFARFFGLSMSQPFSFAV